MKSTWAVLLAAAMALAVAVPAGAHTPGKRDRPETAFKPMACQVDVTFGYARITDVGGAEDEYVTVDPTSGAFALHVEEPGVFWVTRYTVDPGSLEDADVLCVEVTLTQGTLSDLRVRWLDCVDCGLYRATGKDLRNFNNGDAFSAGLSVGKWTDAGGEISVVVMPKAKSDTASMTVKIGIDHPES